MEEVKLPEMPNEFDPLGAISGYGASKAQIDILNKMVAILPVLDKPHFTYKRTNIESVGYLDKVTYEVYFEGKLYSTYTVPFEKIIIMIVEALDNGFRMGGKFVISDLIENISTKK